MKPFFDNIRWGELAGWLSGLSGILAALVQTPLPEQYKSWIMVGIAVIAFFLAFLRNPKSLDWVDEAQEVGAAYTAATKAPAKPQAPTAAEARKEALLRELEALEAGE